MAVSRSSMRGWVLAVGLLTAGGATAFGQEDSPPKEKAPPRQPLTIEATIVRGEEVSRLSVYLRNHSDRPISFDTGARGGRGSLDDRVLVPGGDRALSLVIGTAPTVVPVFRFELNGAEISLEPPRIGGPTSRAMRPHILIIPIKGRVPYASFAVPNSQIAGRFEACEMTIRGDQDSPEPDVVGPWELRLVTDELKEVPNEE